MIIKSYSKTYMERLQTHIGEFEKESGQTLYEASDVSNWAIRTGRWEPPQGLTAKKCREDYARALREQKIKNVGGQPVRVKHVCRKKIGKVQHYFWADIRDAPREHMEVSFQQRRQQIAGECKQLDRDTDYWNTQHKDELPIQLEFDFIEDIEEGRFSGEYPPRKPR